MKQGIALRGAVLAMAVAAGAPAHAAADEASATDSRDEIIVTGAQGRSSAGTKTDTPLIQTPQPITIVHADTYLSQGAISIGDTLRYVAGVAANPYGPDTRVDSGLIRGIDPLQFRDGMRDIFSYYASIRADPYNFSRVEVVRGPASVLFGSGSIGGLINLVSKVPEFETRGEASIRYGSFNRKEALADITGPLTEGLAARLVARVRDADTQTDHVPDDRVMISPSLRWQPGADTDITLLGLYQEDDGGSTSQFLPLVGTIYANPNGKLANSLFIGKPGWDRYDGRLLQGTGTLTQRFGDGLKLNLKARYIDSDLTYLTHYPNSYSNPANPYLDSAQRLIGLYADGSRARMNVFSSDNNIQYEFDTGSQVQHVLLAGVDYSWNRVRKVGGFDFEVIDIYNIDYAALSDYGGGLPTAATSSENVAQRQIGFYVQDQIRIWDRVSVVLGGRRDHVRTKAVGATAEKAKATSFRAGIIGEVVNGVSPFFSYTESFEPLSGTASDGNPYKPKAGRQYELGVKFHPDERTLLTVTGYHIRESNRPIDDPSTPAPFDQKQAGSLTSKGFEIEARHMLPGNFELIANASYNRARIAGADQQLENVPKFNASAWGTKTIEIGADTKLRVGTGVRHTGSNVSGTVRTPSATLVDALAEVTWRKWAFSLNATNLFDKSYYAACLSRGDCFVGADRNIFGTLTYRF